MSAVSDDFSPEQRAFFKFFEIKVPPGVSREGAQRFMQAFLKDPARLESWRLHQRARAYKPPPAIPRSYTLVAPRSPAAGPAAAATARPAAARQTTGAEVMSFTGTGGEYFRIWIVNLALSVVTLGIYSAWAKVRRLQFFYRNTQIAGASFDYDGDPIAILKGRFIALGLFLAYNFSFEASPAAGFATLILLAAALPWLLRNSFRFRLRHSSYRGLRFRFAGDTREAYFTFLLRPLVMFFTLYLAGPWFHQRLKRYQHGSSYFGQTGFAFSATTGQFYRAYLLIAGLMIVVFALAGIVVADIMATLGESMKEGGKPPAPEAFMSGFLIAFAIYVGGMLLVAPLWQARIQNLVWNHTTLGEHSFESRVEVLPLLKIHLTNFIGILLTLGFYTPWAKVRLAQYRVETMTMHAAGDIEQFVAAQVQAVDAAGDETAEMFDLDIGL